MSGPPEGARERLAAAQVALLRALLENAEAPPGFAPERLRAQAEALRRKRRRVVANLRPELLDQLGDRFATLFDSYARQHPRRTGTTARDDADAFARWLAHRDDVPRSPSRWWHRFRS
ncbi:hypothetical protein GCM10012275_27980 [Longimycelium tulufanense]|uniref:SCO6045-like C-terminal domain-containing protein n=1 Tax=Longimycelium tulufanense TaxID=907463 RepID=A0A8J3FV48_9PSEU|nr:hypothetical protein [Longimycelium tulufanense]GGM55242.1 hypothetical protein GCM10012275_27980 [Longimycelium tulufanense]